MGVGEEQVQVKLIHVPSIRRPPRPALSLGEPTPLQRAAGGEGEAAELVRRAAAPWSPASHSLFTAAARARAALLVRSLYEIHERQQLDSTGSTNGVAAPDFSACVLRFAITLETDRGALWCCTSTQLCAVTPEDAAAGVTVCGAGGGGGGGY